MISRSSGSTREGADVVVRVVSMIDSFNGVIGSHNTRSLSDPGPLSNAICTIKRKLVELPTDSASVVVEIRLG